MTHTDGQREGERWTTGTYGHVSKDLLHCYQAIARSSYQLPIYMYDIHTVVTYMNNTNQ